MKFWHFCIRSTKFEYSFRCQIKFKKKRGGGAKSIFHISYFFKFWWFHPQSKVNFKHTYMFTERSQEKFRILWILTLRLKICGNFDDSMKVNFVGEKYENSPNTNKMKKICFLKKICFFFFQKVKKKGGSETNNQICTP